MKYALPIALITISLVLACAPENQDKKVRWDDISHGNVKKNTPYRQSGFGDCDSKDLINFTCE